MYTSISNIMELIIQVLEVNKPNIDALIKQYQPSQELHVYKGMRKSLPLDAFPSLELEPISGSMEWVTTRTQSPRYSIEMTLTIATDNDEMSAEYISELTRVLTQIFNNPQNMSLTIPYETGYLPHRGYGPTWLQFASVDSVSYNANKEGTLRVSQWEWTCQILESFLPDTYVNNDIKETELNPIELPPIN